MAEEIPKLRTEIATLTELTDNEDFLSNKVSMYDNLKVLDDLEATFKQLESTGNKYNNYQEVLGVPGTQFDDLEQVREQLQLRCLMWRSLRDWEESTEGWIKENFNTIDAKGISAKAE